MTTYYEKEELLKVNNVKDMRYEYIDKQRKYVIDTVNKSTDREAINRLKSLQRNKHKGSVPVDYMDDLLLEELLSKGYKVEHKSTKLFGRFFEVWTISWDLK